MATLVANELWQEYRQDTRAQHAEDSATYYGGLQAKKLGGETSFGVAKVRPARITDHFDGSHSPSETAGYRLVPYGHSEYAAYHVGAASYCQPNEGQP